MESLRIALYPKDIMLFTGRSERYARKLVAKIKLQNNKSKDKFITISEFCKYMGVTVEEVRTFVNN
jgi:hypothetical protein